MSHFVNDLEARVSKQLRNGKFERVVMLDSELVYESDLLGSTVIVPSGFASDGASTPRIMWSIYPPFGKYLPAAVLHDYYCVLGNNGTSPIDFKTAALLFREAMEVCGVGKWKRTKMYQAVRWFGPKFKAKVNE